MYKRYLLFLAFVIVVQSLKAQQTASKVDSQSEKMLIEYYGQEEYERKLTCCEKQIARNIYFLQNSFSVLVSNDKNQPIAGKIDEVVLSPVGGQSYIVSAEEMIKLMKEGSFNSLISNVSILKDQDALYTIGDTKYLLLVKSESSLSKKYNSTLK